jgi:23S rRNA (cytosine1962-C5)-methyltransferase
MFTVTLKPKRDRPTRQGHPWIFSGAIDSVSGTPAVGEPVVVCAASGEPLGVGAWSPESQIRVRMWRFGGWRDAFWNDQGSSAGRTRH